MRFRTGVVVGFAIGFYYGAKAGRDRYRQIERVLLPVRRTEVYRSLHATVGNAVDDWRDKVVDLVREASGTPGDARLDDTVELELRPDPSWN